MPKKKAMSARKPRLLWANVSCLLDTTSGASISVRQMLLQLQRSGWEISILGATIFDNERGTAGLKEHWHDIKRRQGHIVSINDDLLQHRLLITSSTVRSAMTCEEEASWFGSYQRTLDQFKPDIVFYYGGMPLDFLIAGEARFRGIKVAFYLVNGNYRKKRWCRDVDLVLTDSQATVGLYKERLDLDVTSVGKFIEPAKVAALKHSRERVLFINPTMDKGAVWVVCLALWLEQRRPEIVFEVVESRGNWAFILKSVTQILGLPRESLHNVTVTPNSDDMRPIYGRARLLLAPSLSWESGSRVVAEAMLNGIPAICTDRGGMPEILCDGGIVLKLPEKYHHKPYNVIPPDEEVGPVAELIASFYDDLARYADFSQRARAVGESRHNLSMNTQSLTKVLLDLLTSS